MPLASVSLSDKYTEESGRIFLTGIQALVRLPILQQLRDQRAGHTTAGFISGYRGSPLGGFDQQLWRARAHLEQHRIHFEPGLNEELAATAVWGSQLTNAFPGARYDGVYALWYGKAPGVDRAGDAFKHGNAMGSSKLGGVLVVAGDDHACKSSSLPSQSEYAFMDAGMPVLNPAGVQEVLDYGLLGWALSRYSGCWVALIALADTMDSSATVYADAGRTPLVIPGDFSLPPNGLNVHVGTPPLEQEERLHRLKLEAARAFARANGLDRTVFGSGERARLGIVTTGKAYLDLCQALEDLGLGEEGAEALGIRLYKVGMSWPLEREGAHAFAAGLDEILVVEEKRGLIEAQLKEALYALPDARRPRIVGKCDENGSPLLPATGDLSPASIARAIATRLPEAERSARVQERLRELDQGEEALARAEGMPARTPFYCSGCPHNLSTKLPEGSRGLAGIGCHFMVQWMDRNTDVFSQMGGEGVQWIGQAPFRNEEHVFANLGDGTYYHSGLLAIRASLAAGVNITYKLLFNDAVAMTGGQRMDGPLDVPRITRQLAAEGVKRIAVVADDPDKYPEDAVFAPSTTRSPRRELETVQRELRETRGCSVIVYDQTCAAELRRRRKRGVIPDPPRRAFINDAVCEGCGDCSEQSNCVSIEPLETELGRKRTINQSSCNKDLSCLEGLCPAFVTVTGGQLRRGRVEPAQLEPALRALPLPEPLALDEPWNAVVTGIGGTGVVTIGALVGMAAHLERKGASVLDMTGLAQKGGAVVSHVRIAARPEDLSTPRVGVGNAHLLLACDPVVAAGREAAVKLSRESTHSLVNTHLAPTAEFVTRGTSESDAGRMIGLIQELSHDLCAFDATRLATAALGDAVATNVLMLGYAFQRGLLPLSLESLERAIELNGVAVEANRQALAWGRLAAVDLDRAQELAGITTKPEPVRTLDGLIKRRAELLTAYQGSALARRYCARVDETRRVELALGVEGEPLAAAVAQAYYKLLAYKDEYEVARLYTDGEFRAKLAAQFEGNFELAFQLAPPLWAHPDPETGRPGKRSYGRWMYWAMRVLAQFKWLRGTSLDIFGYTAERRLERDLICSFESTLTEILAGVDPASHAVAVEVASLPLEIRGFGAVKMAAVERVKQREQKLVERFRKRDANPPVAGREED